MVFIILKACEVLSVRIFISSQGEPCLTSSQTRYIKSIGHSFALHYIKDYLESRNGKVVKSAHLPTMWPGFDSCPALYVSSSRLAQRVFEIEDPYKNQLRMTRLALSVNIVI